MPTESFDGCYLRLWPVAVRLGHLISGSREVGEDLAQDVFVALRDRWESIENPDGYVRRAVVNRAKTAARRRARERTGAVPELPVLPSEMCDVWSALLRLPVHHRAAMSCGTTRSSRTTTSRSSSTAARPRFARGCCAGARS
jgi:DNA-directed RNA polymerase specialized sigma24 family protein